MVLHSVATMAQIHLILMYHTLELDIWKIDINIYINFLKSQKFIIS